MDIVERARLYVEKLESPRRAKSDSQDSHAVVFQVAVILVQGFSLPEDVARLLLVEYCGRSDEPWSEREIEHKLREADKANPRRKRGWLVGADSWQPNEKIREEMPAALPPPPRKAEYVPEALSKVAGKWTGVVDSVWLADRSSMDPAMVDSAGFLDALYDREREKVLVFSRVTAEGNAWTQGEAVWPVDEGNLPKRGRNGVFFLAAPVDLVFRETGREDNDGNPILTRRDGRAVTSWRWMVIESDDAPAREWLAAVAQLPLPICALYTSGGRSVHALVKTEARTKEEWDEVKAELRPGLLTLGADPGCMSAVRLTRLPGTWRECKSAPQKLLYLNPHADGRPIVDLPRKRDVVAEWCSYAAHGPADADETGGQWIVDGLKYYASRSRECREALARFEKMLKEVRG